MCYHTGMSPLVMFVLVFVMALTLTDPSPAPASKPVATRPAREHMKVFLLVGQSNMAGRGAIQELDRQPVDRVITLTQENTWAPAIDPLHFDKPAIIGVGPGKTFGVTIAQAYPNDTIALVPCAFGGTSINQWKPGSKLYRDAIDRARIALKDGQLAGILWHQGESDTDTPERIASYPEKAVALFAAFRKDLDAPNVPVVLGTLGDFLGEKATSFNTMIRTLPEKIPAPIALVESAGLKDKGDKLHFNTEAARELGKRYADAWLKLTQTK